MSAAGMIDDAMTRTRALLDRCDTLEARCSELEDAAVKLASDIDAHTDDCPTLAAPTLTPIEAAAVAELTRWASSHAVASLQGGHTYHGDCPWCDRTEAHATALDLLAIIERITTQ